MTHQPHQVRKFLQAVENTLPAEAGELLELGEGDLAVDDGVAGGVHGPGAGLEEGEAHPGTGKREVLLGQVQEPLRDAHQAPPPT
jgi:hypothetical protein